MWIGQWLQNSKLTKSFRLPSNSTNCQIGFFFWFWSKSHHYLLAIRVDCIAILRKVLIAAKMEEHVTRRKRKTHSDKSAESRPKRRHLQRNATSDEENTPPPYSKIKRIKAVSQVRLGNRHSRNLGPCVCNSHNGEPACGPDSECVW